MAGKHTGKKPPERIHQKRQLGKKQSTVKEKRWRGDGETGQDGTRERELKTAGFLSIRTQQHYGRVKEEVEKKKNKKLWNYYYWQLKFFSPKS